MGLKLISVASMAACLALLCLAQDKVYAPLPDKVVGARTAFLINDSGDTKLGDAVYRELKKWNKWEIVTERGKADLVLVVNRSDEVVGIVSTGSVTGTGTSASGTA